MLVVCNLVFWTAHAKLFTDVGLCLSEEGVSPPTVSVIWTRLRAVLRWLPPKFYVTFLLDRKFSG